MKQQFLKDTADTFRTYIYENNRKVVPSSALLTVYRPGGDSRLVDGAAMAVGMDGLLTYQASASENALVGVNYKALIAYIYNTKTYYATMFYDVVNSRLSKVVTDDDVVTELPQLKDNGWKVRGVPPPDRLRRFPTLSLRGTRTATLRAGSRTRPQRTRLGR